MGTWVMCAHEEVVADVAKYHGPEEEAACLDQSVNLDEAIRSGQIYHCRINSATCTLQCLQAGYTVVLWVGMNAIWLAPTLQLSCLLCRLKEVPLQVGDLQLLKRTREWEVGR